MYAAADAAAKGCFAAISAFWGGCTVKSRATATTEPVLPAPAGEGATAAQKQQQ